MIAITSLSSGLDRAQARVLDPLGSVGTDLLVTRPVHLPQFGQNANQNSSQAQQGVSLSDVQALQNEASAAAEAAVTDLSKLGKPGDHFVHDFFLPATQLTFPAEEAQTMARLPMLPSPPTA